MFGSLQTNMRRVVECLDPLDLFIRAHADTNDLGGEQSQFNALWSHVEHALKCLHDSALDELKQQAAEICEPSGMRQDHVVSAVDHGVYRGETGQIVLRDVIELLSGLVIPAVTVVHFSRAPFKAPMLYGFGRSETVRLLCVDRGATYPCAEFPSRDEDWAIMHRLTVAESSLKENMLKRRQGQTET